MYKRILAAAFAVMIPVAAAASSNEATLPANRSSVIYGFYVADPQNCNALGKPSTAVTAQPQHGRVEFLYHNVTVKNFSTPCNGKVRKAMIVIYTPAAGFHGTDTLSFGMRFPNEPGYRPMPYVGKSLTIHVK